MSVKLYENKTPAEKKDDWLDVGRQRGLLKVYPAETVTEVTKLLQTLSGDDEPVETIQSLEKVTSISPLPITKGSEYVTRDCDSKCEGCRVWRDRSDDEMTSDDWIEVNKQVGQLGLEKMTMLGGEPTLLPGFFDVLRHFETDTSMDYFVITKGVFDGGFDSLIAAAQTSRGTIITSIDTEDTDVRRNYEQLSRNSRGLEFVEKMLQAKGDRRTDVNVGVNIVISHPTVKTFVDHAEHLLEKGVYVNIAPFIRDKPDDPFEGRWVRRGPYIQGLSLEESDMPHIDQAIERLLKLKATHGSQMINSASYISGFNPHAVTQGVRCIELNHGFPTSVRVWSDSGQNGEKGVLQECLDLVEMTKVEHPVTVADLFSLKGRLRYFSGFREHVKDCKGCYWSSMNPTQRS
jgi:hypothetical protein